MVPVHYELWFTSHIQRNVFETQLINSPAGSRPLSFIK